MTKLLLPSLSLLALFAACGNDGKTPTSTPGPGAPAAPMNDHGTPHPLGELTLGAHTFQVIQAGDVVAGKEAAIDLEFPAGKPLPGTVRAWIGLESGQGSMKGRLGKETERIVHGHIEVPKVIPDGSKVWIEIEANGTTLRGSLAWHP
ncbi:MAG: hypothetical protein JNM25_01265 [Planctomycetes bacterium]|nr:hypothetical protein [Planctomycetota bacterium]